MPFPTDEMREQMKAMKMRVVPGRSTVETWMATDSAGDSDEEFVTFYPDQTETHIEGSTSFCKRILAILPLSPTTSNNKEE